MSTLLADLVRKQTYMGVLSLLSRTVDKVAEEMAHDILRDPEFRAKMEQLLRVAMEQALKELHEPAPPVDPRRPLL